MWEVQLQNIDFRIATLVKNRKKQAYVQYAVAKKKKKKASNKKCSCSICIAKEVLK